jgi:hypothetical protein
MEPATGHAHAASPTYRGSIGRLRGEGLRPMRLTISPRHLEPGGNGLLVLCFPNIDSLPVLVREITDAAT